MSAFVVEVMALWLFGVALALGIWWIFFAGHERKSPRRLCALCRRKPVGPMEYICPACCAALLRDRL